MFGVVGFRTSVLSLLALLAVFGPAATVRADCVRIGTAVTCSGNSPNGFATADSGISVTVTPDAVVGAPGFIGIELRNTSTVNNLGSIVVGDNQNGIQIGSNNTIVNNGLISSGDLGGGIVTSLATRTNNTIINNGTITSGMFGVGIAIGQSSTVTNNGTIIVGDTGLGITVGGDNNTLINNGVISVGQCGTGIDSSAGAGTVIRNSGRIQAQGCGSIAVLLGAGNSFTNSGTIQSLAFVPGLGGALFAVGDNNVIANSGTIDGPIDLATASVGNSLTNSGLITITDPWTGIGTFHIIDGTFTQSSTGILALRVDATNNFDSLTVFGTGAANLGGKLRALVQPGLYGNITTFAGVMFFTTSSGQFTSVETSSPFFTATAVYNPGSVDLVLSRVPFNRVPGSSSNASAIGNVLEQAYSPTLTGAQGAAFAQLLASTAPDTLKQLTGEVATTTQTAAFAFFSQFLGLGSNQTGSVRPGGQATNGSGTRVVQTAGNGTRVTFDAADACFGAEACQTRAERRRYSMWVQGFGGQSYIAADSGVGSAPVTLTTKGGATGVDVQLSPEWLVGFTVGGASASLVLDGTTSSGTSSATLFGLYVGWQAGPAYFDAGVGFGFGTFSTNRIVNTGTLAEQISASFSGHLYGGRVEAGWRFDTPAGATITPFAGLGVQAFRSDAYTETATTLGSNTPGVLGLSVQSQTTTSVRSLLGVQVAKTFADEVGTRFTPRVKLGWAHEFNTDRSSRAALATLAPNLPFTVSGARAASDSIVVSAGLDVDIHDMVRLYAQFDGEYSSRAATWSGLGGIRLFW